MKIVGFSIVIVTAVTKREGRASPTTDVAASGTVAVAVAVTVTACTMMIICATTARAVTVTAVTSSAKQRVRRSEKRGEATGPRLEGSNKGREERGSRDRRSCRGGASRT